MQQADPDEAGLGTNAGGFYEVTSANSRKVPLIPTAKNQQELSNANQPLWTKSP